MKNVIFIVITFLSFNVFAQPPGGGGRRQQGQSPQSNQTQKEVKFNASNMAGVFYYDIKEVIKKTKVKGDNNQFLVSKELKNYNFKVKEISFLNSKKFTDLDVVVNSISKGGDMEARKNLRKKVDELIKPVRDDIHEIEKELNDNLEKILSEKQFKKWLKYQKKKKESFQPKRPQNNQRQGQRQMQNGGGMRRQ
ncbi:hypothetical protein [Polaribacter sp. Hel1_85]|uniref:hypothetical protein n=1 Tax=Polaribacter sp. Hel1_85 TaxID=1250005 RepID=UPI00052C55DA|nr:hypothetical protein [Polaribacter sp. Hel1_85]KGL62911.1 hypothetical protein PHEL85_2707 [Polaribacter sp. Hel1_85]